VMVSGSVAVSLLPSPSVTVALKVLVWLPGTSPAGMAKVCENSQKAPPPAPSPPRVE